MRIKKNSKCLEADLNSELILLNLITGKYIQLNETGRIIWNSLDNAKTDVDLKRIIQSEYFTDKIDARVENDIDEFIDFASEAGIVEVEKS